MNYKSWNGSSLAYEEWSKCRVHIYYMYSEQVSDELSHLVFEFWEGKNRNESCEFCSEKVGADQICWTLFQEQLVGKASKGVDGVDADRLSSSSLTLRPTSRLYKLYKSYVFFLNIFKVKQLPGNKIKEMSGLVRSEPGIWGLYKCKTTEMVEERMIYACAHGELKAGIIRTFVRNHTVLRVQKPVYMAFEVWWLRGIWGIAGFHDVTVKSLLNSFMSAKSCSLIRH